MNELQKFLEWLVDNAPDAPIRPAKLLSLWYQYTEEINDDHRVVHTVKSWLEICNSK